MPSTRPALQIARATTHPVPRVSPGGHVRWGVCALLFAATTINYVDRQVIGILKPTLQREFGWAETDYAAIVLTFQLAYAVGLLLTGRLVDAVGTKRGFVLAVLVWSVAALAHAEATAIGQPAAAVLSIFGLTFSTSVAGFMVARLFLGLGEAGNFPAAIKVVAEWFPRRERALATGLFNSGTNVGALLTPLIVPWITLTYGWYWAFVATGALGFVWLLLWVPLYTEPEQHPRLSPHERAYIRSDPPETTTRIPWRSLVRHRQTWAFVTGKFLTDPVWWLYLFWVPDFLNRSHGIDLRLIGPPLVAIYLVADVGSIGGGWLSSRLIRAGWSVNAGRKLTMLLCAVAVLPMMAASGARELWVAVTLISVAAAAHQGWSANLFTLVSDTFPRHAVASVVGLGGMAGAVGGMLIAWVTGQLLEATGSYVPVFLVAAFAYLVALALIHALVPALAPVRLPADRPGRA